MEQQVLKPLDFVPNSHVYQQVLKSMLLKYMIEELDTIDMRNTNTKDSFHHVHNFVDDEFFA